MKVDYPINFIYIYTYQFDSGRCSPHKCCPLCVSKHAGYDNTTIIWHSVLFNGWYLTSVRAEKSFQVCPFFWPIHDVAFSIFLPALTTSGLTRVSNLMLHLAVARWKTSWELPRSQVMPESSARATTVEPWWSMVSYCTWKSHTHIHTHTLAQNCHCEFCCGAHLTCKTWQEQEGVWCGVKGKFFRCHLEEWNKINKPGRTPQYKQKIAMDKRFTAASECLICVEK